MKPLHQPVAARPLTSGLGPSASAGPVVFGAAAADREQHERERAASDDSALVRYLARWERALCRLQRARPERWRVAGLSDDEVRDALTLRLLEAVKQPDERGAPPPAGKPWGLWIMQRHLSVLRKAFRLGATPIDWAQSPLPERRPTQEERYLALEADACRASAGERAERLLSQPQRRWLEAMQHAAADGAFFQASDRLNLSAAARVLGKDRSSAQRAYDALASCYQRELERLE